MNKLPSALLGLALAASLPAQSQNLVWLNDNSPTAGANNVFPWGRLGIRYQCLVPASLLGGRPALIQDLLVTARNADIEVVYSDIEFRWGVTQATALTTSWSANNPNPTTIYRGPLRAFFKKDEWRPVGLPASYLFLPKSAADNLCFEVIIWGVSSPPGGGSFHSFLATTTACPGGTVQRAYYYMWTTSQTTAPSVDAMGNKLGLLLFDGNAVFLGKGCQSSALTELVAGGAPGAWPQLGKPYTVTLSGAAPLRPAFLALGYDENGWAGLPLPFDLTLLGAPGCQVWHNYVQLLGLGTDPAGNAQFFLVIPPGPFMGARIDFSWLSLDPQANSLGVATSSYARLILGT